MAADIFERLKQDHDKHRKLIAGIEQSGTGSEDRARLFEEYKIDATAHAAAEEIALYAALMGESDMRVYAQHSAADHHKIGELFEELAKGDMDSPDWITRFGKLKKEYLEHLDEEEQTIFPRALEDLGEEQAVAMREAFNAQKPEEVERAESGIDEKLNAEL